MKLVLLLIVTAFLLATVNAAGSTVSFTVSPTEWNSGSRVTWTDSSSSHNANDYIVFVIYGCGSSCTVLPEFIKTVGGGTSGSVSLPDINQGAYFEARYVRFGNTYANYDSVASCAVTAFGRGQNWNTITNYAPVFVAPTPYVAWRSLPAVVGSEFSFTVTATDLDGEDVTIEVSGPSDAIISAQTGTKTASRTIRWTSYQAGQYVQFNVKLTDSRGLSSQRTFPVQSQQLLCQLSGDPHIRTWDQTYYDALKIGTYYLMYYSGFSVESGFSDKEYFVMNTTIRYAGRVVTVDAYKSKSYSSGQTAWIAYTDAGAVTTLPTVIYGTNNRKITIQASASNTWQGIDVFVDNNVNITVGERAMNIIAPATILGRSYGLCGYADYNPDNDGLCNDKTTLRDLKNSNSFLDCWNVENPNVPQLTSSSSSTSSTTSSSTTTSTSTTGVANQAPSATSDSITLNENDPTATLTLQVSDPDTPLTSVSAIITSLPSSSIGVLVDEAGNAISVNSKIVSPRNVYFRLKSYSFGTTSFTFKANDGLLDSANTATFSIVVNHVNHQPWGAATTPVVATRTQALAITLTANEYDVQDTVFFTVTGYSANGGVFQDASNNNFGATTPLKITSNLAIPTGSVSTTVYYTAPITANTNPFAYLIFTVTDNSGSVSSPVRVDINIRPNNPPVANPAGPITVVQDSVSGSFTLTATDPDVNDVLTFYTLSIPSRGTLSYVSTGASITSTGTLTSTTLQYRTTSRGSDSFIFQVRDALGATSNQVKVTINITPVNHPPTGSIANATTPQNTRVPITTITASDVDGDSVQVIVSSVPAVGTLYQADGVTVVSAGGKVTDAAYGLVYAPPTNVIGKDLASFSIYVDDSQSINNKSPTYTSYITVTFVNQPPTAVDGSLTLNQNDQATSITLSGADFDNFPNPLAAYLVTLPDANLGVLIDANGNALSTGSSNLIANPRVIRFRPATNAYGTTSFQFRTYDGALQSSAATFSIEVKHVNQAPTASAVSPVTAVRTVALTITLNANDVDRVDTETFVITNVNSNGGQFTDNAGNGFGSLPYQVGTVSTTTGAASLNIKYTAPATATGNNFASITFNVVDQGGLTSNSVTVSINIVPNTPPTANPAGPITVAQDFPSSAVTLSGNDDDVADATTLKVIIANLPTNGKIYFGGNVITVAGTIISTTSTGSVTYKTNNRGTDSFGFRVQDTLGAQSAIQTVQVTITNTNHAPIGSISPVTTPQNQRVTINSISAYDSDSDPLTVTIQTLPNGILYQADGATVINAGDAVTSSDFVVVYQPPTNKYGNPFTWFTFYVSDGQPTNGRSSTVNGTITVTFVNQPPTATPVSKTIAENDPPVPVNLDGTDVEGDVLTSVILSLPDAKLGTLTNATGGQLRVGAVVTSRVVLFAPVANAHGTATFTFKVNDGKLDSNAATATVVITPVDQTPVCSITPTSPIVVPRPGSVEVTFVAFDPDAVTDSQSYTFAISGWASTGGSLTKNGQPVTGNTVLATGVTSTSAYVSFGPYVFSVTGADSGDDLLHFDITVTDDASNSCSQHVQFNSVASSPPEAIPVGPYQPLEEQFSEAIPLEGTDEDPIDQGNLTTIVVTLPKRGLLYLSDKTTVVTAPNTVITDRVVYYRGNALFFGADVFSWLVKDTAGLISDVSSVDIEVIHVNHAPVGVFNGVVSTLENTAVNITGISAFDIDNDTPLDVYISVVPESGKLYQKDGTTEIAAGDKVADAGYQIVYVPELNKYGDNIASFKFYVDDNHGATSQNVTVPIRVIFVNQAPVAYNGSVTLYENSDPVSLELAASDVENAQADIIGFLVTSPEVTLGVLQDAQGNALSVGQPLSTRTIYFKPAPYQFGNSSFTFRVYDGALYSSVATFSIAVIHVNHKPIADANTPVVATRGGSIAITLRGTDVDVIDSLSFIITNVNGAFTVGGAPLTSSTVAANQALVNGEAAISTITYTPDIHASGANYASLTYKVNDGTVDSEEFVVVVDITPNTPPVATPAGPISVLQDGDSNLFALTGTDADIVDNTTLKVIIAALPTRGTVLVGTVAITAVGQEFAAPVDVHYKTTQRGTDSLRFRVKDNLGALSADQTVQIVITAVNHPPVGSFTGVVPVLQSQNVTITQISASDPDGDTPLRVFVTALPTGGTLYQTTGAVVNVGDAITDAAYTLVFVPSVTSGDQTFTFYVNDLQADNNVSAPVIGYIRVVAVNQAPVPIGGSFTTPQYSAGGNITLRASDADNTDAEISAYLTSLPNPEVGILYDLSGKPLGINQQIPAPRTIRFVPTANNFGITSFNFRVFDGIDFSSSFAVQNIRVTHVNTPPTASAASPVVATRTVSLAISVSVTDVDTGDIITVSVANITDRGVFTSADGAILQVGSNIANSTTLPASKQLSFTVNFVAPKDAVDPTGAGYASITFVASDQSSKSVPAIVNVLLAQNHPPTATPVEKFAIAQYNVTDVFTLNGDDVDVADADSLKVVILTQPTKGTLIDVVNGPISSFPVTVTEPAQVYYNNTDHGTDSFTWKVVDNVNAESSVETVTIAITPAPVIIPDTSSTTGGDSTTGTGTTTGGGSTTGSGATPAPVDSEDDDDDDVQGPIYVGGSGPVIIESDHAIVFNNTELEQEAYRVCSNLFANDTVFYRSCLIDISVTGDVSAVSYTAVASLVDCQASDSAAACKNASIFACPDACNYNGKCVNSVCECNSNYKGVSCSEKEGLTTAETAAVIAGGAVAGIVIGVVAFVAISSYGAKKGYQWLKEHSSPVFASSDNPLYEAHGGNADNPLYESANNDV